MTYRFLQRFQTVSRKSVAGLAIVSLWTPSAQAKIFAAAMLARDVGRSVVIGHSMVSPGLVAV